VNLCIRNYKIRGWRVLTNSVNDFNQVRFYAAISYCRKRLNLLIKIESLSLNFLIIGNQNDDLKLHRDNLLIKNPPFNF